MAALIALVAAQAKVRGQLTAAAVGAAVAAFQALAPGDWWDGKKTSHAIAVALKVVQANQRQAARVTDAYLARAVSVLAGRRAAPAGIVDVTRLRRVMPQQVVEDLVAGRIEPVTVLLGEVDFTQRQIRPAPSIGDPMPLVVPDPGAPKAEQQARVREKRPAAQVAAPAEAYGRVADQYRFTVVAKDMPEPRARQFALARVAAVAETDITLAVREQVRNTLGKIKGVEGYRRILRPELSRTGPCGLCVVAADRVYKVEDLKPIHDRCCCEVLPIIGDLDPGIELNVQDLEALYDLAGGTGGRGLKRIRVALVEHGELGPVLVDADHQFRGPREVALTRTADRRAATASKLETWEESFARLTRRALAGEDVSAAMQWQEKLIGNLRRDLAAVS